MRVKKYRASLGFRDSRSWSCKNTEVFFGGSRGSGVLLAQGAGEGPDAELCLRLRV